MTNHDYAACQDQICVRCEAYGDGYTAGKEKAHLEVRNTFTDNHAPDCGCEPCITRRTLARGIAYDAALKTAFTIVDQPYRTEDWLDLCNEIARSAVSEGEPLERLKSGEFGIAMIAASVAGGRAATSLVAQIDIGAVVIEDWQARHDD